MIRKLYNKWFYVWRYFYKHGKLNVPRGKRLGWTWPKYFFTKAENNT